MIRFEHVSKRYAGGSDALKDISFTLQAGELAFVTGHSGAGKSTLLKLIAGIEKPSRGLAVVNGQNLAKLSRRRLPYYRRSIGMIFQDHKLLPELTVADNVALPLVVAGHRGPEVGRRVRAALDKVGLLGKERSLPQALSGGEQQRVGIARALVARPPLLLADEPTGNLDPELSREVMRLFRDFNQVGVAVLIASHDHALIEEMDARTLTLHAGCLIGDA
ncbi:cell division ATP-binding protein FtsE [Immundisolibacter sp.]|uniref:cell division ATP-binding protein FtsE n=1 Tax=Immundisolibacter sp. TaxID=1934948 RepID=UPI00261B1A9B|nr:cell division ATP-binding protein FtsE [Immundisolibacter sp.]MDD3652271.1 cell division ATP-binding protein FtsE [Immundisolibacter sp.]